MKCLNLYSSKGGAKNCPIRVIFLLFQVVSNTGSSETGTLPPGPPPKLYLALGSAGGHVMPLDPVAAFGDGIQSMPIEPSAQHHSSRLEDSNASTNIRGRVIGFCSNNLVLSNKNKPTLMGVIIFE